MKILSAFCGILLIVFMGFFFNTSSVYAVAPDQTFGTNGKVITRANDSILEFALQTDGKIVTLGSTSAYSNSDIVNKLTRYNSNGTLDTTFGSNGQVAGIFSQLTNIGPSKILVQPDGKIIVACLWCSTVNNSFLVRFLANGTLDTSYGINGFVSKYEGEYVNDANIVFLDAAIQADGKIVMVGEGYKPYVGQQVVVLRYNTDGTLDTTFGDNGLVTNLYPPVEFSYHSDQGKKILIQSDQRIIIYSEIHEQNPSKWVTTLLRLTTEGSLDTSFGTNGIVREQTLYESQVVAVQLSADNSIVTLSEGDYYFEGEGSHTATHVHRYTPNGQLDAGFGNNGQVMWTTRTNDWFFPLALALQVDGKILVGGYFLDGEPSHFGFSTRRLLPNGTFDTTFGPQGVYILPLGDNSSLKDFLAKVMVLPDAKILLGGNYSLNREYFGALVRLDPNASQPLPSPSASPSPSSLPTVPLIKQSTAPWGGQEYATGNTYDNNRGYDCGKTIRQCGCALTSAVMIFNYHGIKKMPDGTALDPGSLNTWLKSQPDGYIDDGLVNFYALPRLSTEAKAINAITAFNALKYSRVNSNDITLLKTELTAGRPAILEEKNHFIVGTGIFENTFTINDPSRNITLLSDSKYNNSFKSIRKFIPSHTDLSYIVVVSKPGTSVKILNSQGTDLSTSFLEEQIIDENNPPEQPKPPLQITQADEPASGTYTIVISNTTQENNPITLYLYDIKGEVAVHKQSLIPGTTSFSTAFDKENITNTDLLKLVTFDSVLSEIQVLSKQGQINKSLAKSVSSLITNARKELERGRKKNSLRLLDTALGLLKVGNKKQLLIKNEAYYLITTDITELKKIVTSN